MSDETITISLSELKKKNDILWLFVKHHFPFAQGDLDKYLDLAVEKERFEKGMSR